MKPKQLEAIRKHGEQLNAIFHTGLDPVTLCKKLRRIESAAHKLAEDACNFLSMDSAEFVKRDERILDRLIQLHIDLDSFTDSHDINKFPVFVDYDPRGYALKIDDEYMRAHNIQLAKDWGGYGILAPEINEKGE